eukprot:INCI3137.2.p1 GENE.INCI3137.2~~INCI3137.2.p1  ORF type:complete len:600 (+),score=105.50 INCI3137.2:310-2109(+)
MAAATTAGIEAQVGAFVAQAVSPGGDFEIGLDSWLVNNELVTFRCFKGRQHCPTMGEFYRRHMLSAENRDREFIVYDTERYTFDQVYARASALAHVLQKTFSINKGDRVCIAMRNFPEWCIAFIATTAIGSVAVPVNGWWGPHEMEYGLQDSGAKVLICDQERHARAAHCLGKLGIRALSVRAEIAGVASYEKLVGAALASGTGMPEVQLATDDAAAMMYTSGTTGHPKGVVLTHRGISNQMSVALLATAIKEKTQELTGQEPPFPPCCICPVPLFHVTACHHLFLSSIAVARKFVLMYKWDAGKALELIERERATDWTGVPTMVQDLMEHPDFATRDTSSLVSVGGGGAPTPISQVSKVSKKFKRAAPSQGYGLTETNGAVCTNNGKDYMSRPGSCGKPFPIVDWVIVDVDTNEVLPPGGVGELLMKSPLVMSHYHNKPDKSAEVLVSVKGRGAGWFRSGDVARLDNDGYCYIMDRVKDIIIRGGENISCAEVEAAVHEHPSVMEVAAFGIKDERLGEEVGIMVHCKKGIEAPSTVEMRTFLIQGQKLAGFKIPLAHHIFFSDAILPRGATGKILKRSIRDDINSRLASEKEKPRARL